MSDAERQQVAERLSRHFAEGRLDQGEFDLRLGRATSAVTRGDLRGLFDDLPPLAEEAPPSPRRHRRLLPLLVAVVLVAIAIESAISMVRVPWLLVLVVALLLWHRFGRHDQRRRSPSEML